MKTIREQCTELAKQREETQQAWKSGMFSSMIDSLFEQYREQQNQDRFLPPDVAERLKKIRERIPSGVRPIVDMRAAPFYKILKEKYDEQQQIKLMKYMTRVQDKAAQKMLDDESFAANFLEKDEFSAVVLSLDIRRSTELMLKAETPQVYAEFINNLTAELTDAVKSRFGIYDKFTGDGLLAFFPDFYSGSQAILYALQCADDCHEIFNAIFPSYRSRFDIGDMQTGLGIGIDDGQVFKAGIELEYTVVGKPVVYACRLSSAPAGHTYLTGLAEKALRDTECDAFITKKTEIEIKHEGLSPAFDVMPVTNHAVESMQVKEPSWCGGNEQHV
jgi:class 3 adenylate cyclase